MASEFRFVVQLLLLLTTTTWTAAEKGGGCACDHGTTKLCCGQPLDGGKPTCGEDHGCGNDLPLCAGYVNNKHLGFCVAASCSVEMTGAALSCPAHTIGGTDTCIVKHSDAEEVCKKTHGCEYIGICSRLSEGCGGWNSRYKDSVQLGAAPLKRNTDWIACRPGTEPGAPTSDLGAYFVLLLALVSGVYIGGGVGVGMRSGGRTRGKSVLQAHPHFQRWMALSGLLWDGVQFAQGQRGRGGASSNRIDARKEPLLRDPSASRKSSWSSKKKQKERQRKEQGTDDERARRGVPSAVVDAESPDGAGGLAVAPTAVATPAGGGGRWIHVPS